MPDRRSFGAVLAGVATMLMMCFAAAGPAAATDPVDLGSSYVLDDVGALSAADETSANGRLAALYASTGVDLYVVFVDEFTNPANSQEWADAVAAAGGLGPTQYILAVATESRQFYTSADSSGPVTEDQLLAIEAGIKPLLSDGDYLGAVVAAADGFESALNGGSSSGGGFFGTVLVIVVVAAIAALIIWLVVRSRRRRSTTPAVEAMDLGELTRRAASALVATDDAIKTSEQELGFARAQFGDAAATEFETTLAAATASLNEAFTLQQQLDDAEPDTDAQKREWNLRILELCEGANRALDEKAADFDALRELEKNAPDALERVSAERERVASRLPDAERTLAGITEAYHPDAIATVADNPTQVQERLAFADSALSAARAAIAAGRSADAAVSIRGAEDAVAQAEQLERAIDTLAADLRDGAGRAQTLIAQLEADIATAKALPDTDGRLAGVIAGTVQQVDAARGMLAASQQRPLAALHALEAADQQIDTVVQQVRDAQAQAQRAQQALAQVMMQAGSQISAADDFIASRRGAVGAEARTRLAEAKASLAAAQQAQIADPAQALPHAQRAEQLAAQSIQAAQRDVGAFSGGGYGSPAGGGANGMMGAVLGGIVINSMLGGGSRRAGGFGGGFGGGSRRSGGGGMRPGSFGGGGTRGRRGGGRF